MDKRYFLIIIIVLICVTNMYLISTFSDVVGSASVNIGHYTCSIPNDFNVMNTYDSSVVLNNPNSGLSMSINSHEKDKAYNFSKGASQLSKNPSNNVLSNGTINVGGVQVESIYYSHKDNNITSNRSVFYFEKNNDSFTINMENFDYKNDREKTIDILSVIVDSFRPNYKKQ